MAWPLLQIGPVTDLKILGLGVLANMKTNRIGDWEAGVAENPRKQEPARGTDRDNDPPFHQRTVAEPGFGWIRKVMQWERRLVSI